MNKGKKWGIIVGLILSLPAILLIVSIFAGNKNTTKEKIDKVVSEKFQVVGIIEDGETLIIFANGNSDKESIDGLRYVYSELGKMKINKDLHFGIGDKNGIVRFSSSVSKESLKSIKWNDIKTYEEFYEEAYLQKHGHS